MILLIIFICFQISHIDIDVFLFVSLISIGILDFSEYLTIKSDEKKLLSMKYQSELKVLNH